MKPLIQYDGLADIKTPAPDVAVSMHKLARHVVTERKAAIDEALSTGKVTFPMPLWVRILVPLLTFAGGVASGREWVEEGFRWLSLHAKFY